MFSPRRKQSALAGFLNQYAPTVSKYVSYLAVPSYIRSVMQLVHYLRQLQLMPAFHKFHGIWYILHENKFAHKFCELFLVS